MAYFFFDAGPISQIDNAIESPGTYLKPNDRIQVTHSFHHLIEHIQKCPLQKFLNRHFLSCPVLYLQLGHKGVSTPETRSVVPTQEENIRLMRKYHERTRTP